MDDQAYRNITAHLQRQYKPTFKQRLDAKRIALNKQVLHRNSERKMAQSLK
jgi:hypothetical protein